jgi:hypothetical protein
LNVLIDGNISSIGILMKISKRRSRRKYLIVAIVTCVIAAIISGIIYWNVKTDGSQVVAESEGASAPAAQRVASDQIKSRYVDAPASDSVPTSESMSVVISELSYVNGKVTIVGIVDGIQSGLEKGQCVVEFTTDRDRPVVKQTDININNSEATCGPIVIDAYNFSYIGKWNVVMKVYAGDKQAVSPKNEVTIE